MRWFAQLLGLNWITGIGLGGLLTTSLALSGTVWWQSGRIERLEVEAAALDRCTARIINMLEARTSDATVDPDDLSGFTVPDEWLREAD